MKAIRWNPKKNEWLRATRGIGFELAEVKIASGDILGVVDHPNKARYPQQRIFVLEFSGYAFLVPFVETDEDIFLKTMIPSRQATRHYLGGGKK